MKKMIDFMNIFNVMHHKRRVYISRENGKLAERMDNILVAYLMKIYYL